MKFGYIFVAKVMGVIGILAASALVGCKPNENKTGNAPPPVRIGYFANLTHAQAVLGVASGELAQAVAPRPLKTKIFNAGPSLIEALFAGEIDLGYIGPSPVINAYAQSKGRGLRVIAGAAANGVVVVARKDSGIKTLQDLKGRRLATPQLGNTQDVSARHYLQEVLKQDHLSNVVPIANAEQLTLLTRGDIDASWVPEPWGSRLIVEGGAVLVGEEKDLWPKGEFGITLVITTPEFLAQHPELVEKVLEVHVSWTDRLNREPQKYLSPLGEALFALNGKKLPEGVVPAALGRIKFTADPLESSLQTFADWAYHLKLTKTRTDLTGLVDTTLLQKVQARGSNGR